ncbi:MAG: nicotinamide-nucleotide amidohydrolase family protein [Gammaproteobacteria bacterium]|nr:nicotinamide-nucleotide amidohydrolase family protein [Gammaproteobacteria bacterium]MCP5136977.1 nicotinamide-nucleotide amidohydrolase family protein [Gammaproteobacteria bacterium]
MNRRGDRIAVAESCTGGGLAQACTDQAGSSTWFDRGFVTYSNEAKQDMLGVRVETLADHGAVSEAVVREMAQGAIRHSRANVSVAISGIAGPGGGTADKPVGTIWFAWAVRGEGVRVQRARLFGNRETVRRQAVLIALAGLIDAIRPV